MKSSIIHIYMMPGLAANPSIFEFVKLPEEQFEIHWLEWFIPSENQTLQDYAQQMCAKIKHDNVVLLGVSFGGILVQEMAKLIVVRQVIVVSSVQSKYELPAHFKFAKITKAYKLLPTGLLSVENISKLEKLQLGETINKRVELYKKFLSVNDKQYLDWAIEQVISWDQEAPNPDTVFIHGNKDMVFPHSCKDDCHVIDGGTHIMIINRAKWFNENLPKIILEQK